MNAFGKNLRSQISVANTLQRLLLINIIFFIVIRITNAITGLFLHPIFEFPDVSHYLAVPAGFSELIARPWTIVTYMFFHWDILHIFFNMLWLFWMGKIFQEYLGNEKLLNTYITGGLAGAFAFIIAYNLFPLFSGVVYSAYALGASASVLAITVATATLLPTYPIQIIFIGVIQLRWVALVTIMLDMISVSGSNAGGHIAHLGGALYGFIYIRQLRKGNDITAWLTKFFSLFSLRKNMKVVRTKKKKDEDYNLNRKASQERMDDILDKISKSGYGSLSREEKEFLHHFSKEN
jgi:membrane associated rhomboid family serine protease